MPRVAPSSYVDSSAQLVGDIVIGERSSVWLNVSARGDVNYIRIGDETNIQDNTVLHVDHETHPLIIGNRVTVGHCSMLHGCEIGDGALIGIGAIILNGAKIGPGAVVAAGSVVPERMEVPPNTVVMGAPAKVRRGVTPEERKRFHKYCENYIRLTSIYKEEQA